MVEMFPVVVDGVVLVGVGLLPEQDVLLLERPGQHHGLLVVDVIVVRAVHQVVLLGAQVVQPPQRRARVVPLRVVHRPPHVPLRVH